MSRGLELKRDSAAECKQAIAYWNSWLPKPPTGLTAMVDISPTQVFDIVMGAAFLPIPSQAT